MGQPVESIHRDLHPPPSGADWKMVLKVAHSLPPLDTEPLVITANPYRDLEHIPSVSDWKPAYNTKR